MEAPRTQFKSRLAFRAKWLLLAMGVSAVTLALCLYVRDVGKGGSTSTSAVATSSVTKESQSLRVAQPGVAAVESDRPARWILAATTPGRNAGEGTAALGPSHDDVLIYSANGILPNGARLREIYSDRVVLARDGLETTLYLNPDTRSTDAADGGALALQDVESMPIEAPPLEPIAAAVRSKPVYVDGEFKGIQVDPAVDESGFSELGFVRGDVVTAIAGERLTQTINLAERLRSSDSRAPVQVTLERDGRTEQVSVDLTRTPPLSPEARSAMRIPERH